MTLADLTTFLGWCTVINAALLLFATISIISMRGFVSGVHGRMFGIEPTELSPAYFNYLANFKILTLVFNLTPYLVLRLFM